VRAGIQRNIVLSISHFMIAPKIVGQSDLALIVRAAREAGLDTDFYTLNGNNFGVPSAMGAAGQGRVKLVSAFSPNSQPLVGDSLLPGFKRQFNEDFINGLGHNALLMLAQGIREAKSVEPAAVAARMSGMRFDGINGPVEMRKSDHQLQQGLYIARWEKAGGKYPMDSENTGYTFAPVKYFEPYVASTPTSCQMKRPS
jgi:branched-chain amino acid transport system substrate-binding protein